MKFDGIIFDLDGTLWDSCRVVADSWGESLRRNYGAVRVPGVEDVRGIMGMTAVGIAEKLFSHYGERAMEVCHRCMTEELEYISEHSGDVYPGVEDMLRLMSESYPLFIVSNCQNGYIQCFFKPTGFEKYIKDIECAGSSGLEKADNIRIIMARNGLKNPVYIGDTAGDEKSARSAGCCFVHAAYGFGRADAPDAVLRSPAQLSALIHSLEEE
jgi:phosphoglycolate phosphatase